MIMRYIKTFKLNHCQCCAVFQYRNVTNGRLKSKNYYSTFLTGRNFLNVPRHKLVNKRQFSFYKPTLDKLKYLNISIKENFEKLYKNYEEYVGLKDVQEAQLEVKNAEQNFLASRSAERLAMHEVVSIREELKHIRERLTHVSYSSPLYPQLANEQHNLVTKEEEAKLKLDGAEEHEREAFHLLSGAMRDSYEKERSRVERTKNWSLIGSVIGTILGFLGSSYINRVRMGELNQMVKEGKKSDYIKENIEALQPFIHERYINTKEEISQLEAAMVGKLLQSPEKNNEELDLNKLEYVITRLYEDVQQIKASLHNNISAPDKGSLQALCTTDAESVTSSNAETTQKLDEKDVSVDQNLSTNSAIFFGSKSLNGLVVWGLVMSALYFIITT